MGVSVIIVKGKRGERGMGMGMGRRGGGDSLDHRIMLRRHRGGGGLNDNLVPYPRHVVCASRKFDVGVGVELCNS